jgi:hypothetical protein
VSGHSVRVSNDGVKLGDAFRGAVLVAKGQAVLLETYGGLADARDGTTSTAATRFQLASVSKQVDHVTVFRWVQRFTPLFADAAGPSRHAVGDRWFVDETYVKVAGRWR